MKVFVSHSMKDQSILLGIKYTLNSHGIQLFIAEHEVDMQNSITEKIKRMIDSSHVGLILLTKNGIKSGFVREEIGYLEAKRIPSLIILEKGVEKEYGGFKYGHDYIELDTDYPDMTIEKVKRTLLRHWNRLIEQQKHFQEAQEEQRRRNQNNALIGIGIVAGLLILGSKE
jgi:hypothetical protein